MPCKLCKNALGYGLFRGGNFRQDVWFSILQTMRCLEVELVDFKTNICCKRLHFLNKTIVFIYCPIKEKIQLLTGSRERLLFFSNTTFLFAWKSTAFLWCTCICKEERRSSIWYLYVLAIQQMAKANQHFHKVLLFSPSHSIHVYV